MTINLEIEQQGESVGGLNYPEIRIIKENGQQDETVYINMEFLRIRFKYGSII